MARKNTRNTKGRIIEAAWRLFYQQGYDDTTVEEIIMESGTSRGSFYHYFEGKDALLSTVSYLFDQKYEELMADMDPALNRFDQLMFLNRELFAMIENSISLDLLARLYSSQLITRGEKHLLDHNRTYFKVLLPVPRPVVPVVETDFPALLEIFKEYPLVLLGDVLVIDICVDLVAEL